MWSNLKEKTKELDLNNENYLDDIPGLPSRVFVTSDKVMPLDNVKNIEICNVKDYEGNKIPNKYCIIFSVDRSTAFKAKENKEGFVCFDDRNNEYKIYCNLAGTKKEGILHRLEYNFTTRNGEERRNHCYMYE